MKTQVKLLVVAFFLLFFSGCSSMNMKDIGSNLKTMGSNLRYDIQGEYYLQNKDFKDGGKAFAKLLREDPNNSRVHYYYGRFLLAEDKNAKALTHLKKAVAMEPEKTDYLFWRGVAYGVTGNQKRERKSYEQVLKKDPKHLLALIHLGHNMLRRGRYQKSLQLYERALKISPQQPQPLYNRAYILNKLKRYPEERHALLTYLDYYPSGNFARLATDRLNVLKDYSYRNYTLGIRTVTLTDIGFVPLTAQIKSYARPSLNLVGATVANMKSGTLNILVYQLNNKKLAKKRAIAIQRYLYKKYPSLKSQKRIRLSWFGTAEHRRVRGKKLVVNQSVDFFLTGIKKHSSKTKHKIWAKQRKQKVRK